MDNIFIMFLAFFMSGLAFKVGDFCADQIIICIKAERKIKKIKERE